MIAARLVTPHAARWLRETRAAHVLCAFDRACNLVNEKGDLLTLLAAGMRLNPFALSLDTLAPAPFQSIAGDTVVRLTPKDLTVGTLQVAFTSAVLWNAAPDWAAIRQAMPGCRPLLAEVARWAVKSAPAASLLDLWPGAQSVARIPDRHVAFLDRVRQRSHELVAGLGSGSPDRACSGAHGLAGLGGGLTPAGDDFIVGVMLAAWAGLLGPQAAELAPAVAEAAAPRTTTLSAAYLRAAAQGECMERWHDFFAALCNNDVPGLQIAVGELLSVGHTSGADALAGFLAAEYLPIPVN